MDLYLQKMEEHRHRLLQLPNVTGVGVGYKEVGGKPTGDLSIVVFVEKKIPRQGLGFQEIVPEDVDGARTDVIETGRIYFQRGFYRTLAQAQPGRTGRWRPIPPGVSIGHYQVSAGTLGAWVYDLRTGSPLLLSNNHVLANATDGTDGRSAAGDAILQPGRHDGGRQPQDVVGYLERFVPLQKKAAAAQADLSAARAHLNDFLASVGSPLKIQALSAGSGAENRVDAAVARPVDPRLCQPAVLGLGPVRGIRAARPGMAVVKSGRTTELTRGQVRAVEASVSVHLPTGEPVQFVHQVVATGMSKPGDSGSLVCDGEGYAVGLLFAGSDQATVFSPIGDVLQVLEVSLTPP